MGHGRSRGFTLIELMVVVAIMGILLAIVIPNVRRASVEAEMSAARSQMANIGQAVELYRTVKRRLPSTLSALTEEDETGEAFIEVIPRDPWRGEYEYRKISRRRYEIRSMGRDGAANTDDDLVHPVYLRDP